MQVGGLDNVWEDLKKQNSRMQIWYKKLSGVAKRLQGVSLQKIAASDDGLLILSVYKPCDDRTSVVMNIKRNNCSIECVRQKPLPSQKPNSFVQIARKYLVGRRVKSVSFSISPICFFIDFEPLPEHILLELKEKKDTVPNCLMLDFEEARLCISSRLCTPIPKRYEQITQAYTGYGEYFESFGEWSLEGTKTKRRSTFSAGLVESCFVAEIASIDVDEKIENSTALVGQIEKQLDEPQGIELKTGLERELDLETKMTLPLALDFMPTHFRRAVRTKLQFLQRRIGKQKGDLPSLGERDLLKKRCAGLQANLYMWPKGFPMWHVPPNLIEEFGLPLVITLPKGFSPGDLLEKWYTELEKVQKRESQLLVRVAESEQALKDFETLICYAGDDIRRTFAEIEKETGKNLTADDKNGKSFWELNKKFSQNFPPSIGRLEMNIETKFFAAEQQQKNKDQDKVRRLPYRQFRSKTGEFLRVSKSAQDADDMLRLIPSHHTWVHIMAGEGSHVWVEKPKKAEPSTSAIRDAAMLAIHHSKAGRSLEGEVYVAKRADIEKKKDLAPGKVIVKRSTSLFLRYEEPEIRALLESGAKK